MKEFHTFDITEKNIFIVFFKQDLLLLTLAFLRTRLKGNERSYGPFKKYVNEEAVEKGDKKMTSGEEV